MGACRLSEGRARDRHDGQQAGETSRSLPPHEGPSLLQRATIVPGGGAAAANAIAAHAVPAVEMN